ncbi:MAG: YchF/TatD family DNA exonuclease [Deltaproteobacteria bacterium]|nr:YchF/TatD family DNA exonuclease [Deltaproteobacteria bacterium]
MGKPLFIDTHAHLDDERYDVDRPDVLKRAEDAGLKHIITVGCWDRVKGFQPVIELIKAHGFISASLGVHPHEARSISNEDVFNEIRDLALAFKQRIAAIGETGLDYYKSETPKDAQKRVFARQIALARELNLPLIIHSREAHDDTMGLLESEGASSTGGVFHCFSGNPQEAKEALNAGFYISFTGVITFKNAQKLREAVKAVPIERMLIETDCPYLAPEPHRGQRNEPSYVVQVAKAVAEIKAMSLDDVARLTTANAIDLFGLDGGAGKEEPKIAYRIRNSLYLNITNRCTNHCTFCAKFKSYTVKGHYLRLRQEPDFADVVRAAGPEPEKYDEVVFCGFGEPLIRVDLVRQAGMHFKRLGCKIRIDTDGLANLVHKRNVLPELMFVDCISVSLNAPDSDTYQRLVKTPFGDKAYPAILYFLREAKKFIPKVVASVVAVPGLDIEACRKVAEDDLGVAFRIREYDNVG